VPERCRKVEKSARWRAMHAEGTTRRFGSASRGHRPQRDDHPAQPVTRAGRRRYVMADDADPALGCAADPSQRAHQPVRRGPEKRIYACRRTPTWCADVRRLPSRSSTRGGRVQVVRLATTCSWSKRAPAADSPAVTPNGVPGPRRRRRPGGAPPALTSAAAAGPARRAAATAGTHVARYRVGKRCPTSRMDDAGVSIRKVHGAGGILRWRARGRARHRRQPDTRAIVPPGTFRSTSLP